MTRKQIWEMLEKLEKGQCFKSDVMDAVDAYHESSGKAAFVEGAISNSEENKYHFAREVLFNLRSCHAVTEAVYLRWIKKLNVEESLLNRYNQKKLKNTSSKKAKP